MIKKLLTLQLPGLDPKGSETFDVIGPGGAPTGGLTSGETSLQTIIQRGATIVIAIAIVLALIFLIWGGVQWIMSGGDKHKIDQARTRIIYALIGLMVIFFSYFIVRLIGNMFGIDVLCISSSCRF